MRETTKTAEIFKAMGHAKRLAILLALKENGALCVYQIMGKLRDYSVSQSSLSMYLTVLKRAGCVESKKIGTSMFYSISSNVVKKCLEGAQL